MTDDQFLLANAYVDDELDAVERAQAEADPVVMSEVDALRALRDDLRDVAPASSVTRTTAIAAALQAFSPAVATQTASVFDPPVAHTQHPSSAQLSDRPQLVSTDTPTDIRDRAPSSATSRASNRAASRWATPSRLLGVAAALVGVGIAGVVVLNSRGDSDESGNVAFESDSASASATGAVPAPASPPPPAQDSNEASATSDVQLDVDSAVSSTAPFGVGGDSTDTVVVETLVPVIPIPTLNLTAAELKAIAEDLLADGSSATDDSTDAVIYDCVLPTPVNSTLIGHATVTNDNLARPTVTLLIVADEARDNAYAVDPETCFVVQTARLYP